jgi:hypothetical protein
MERTIDRQCFMLGALDSASENLPPGVRGQLDLLLDQFGRSIAPPRLPDAAAPVPGTVNSAPALNFMKAVREIVRAAIEAQGGEMRSE